MLYVDNINYIINLHYRLYEVGTNIIPILQMGHWQKGLRSLSNVPHVLSGRIGIQSQGVEPLIYALNHLHIY